MLIVDSMVHLRSDTPIQCRPPVAQSQLLNRELSPSEPTEEHLPPPVNQEMDTHAISTTSTSTNISPAREILQPQPQPQPLLSPHLHRTLETSQKQRSSPIHSMATGTPFTQAMPITQVTLPPHLRVTTSFGYCSSTTEL